MVATATITMDQDRMLISGDLNFQTVMKLWNQSLAFLVRQNNFIFDFINVKHANSAGLALILEWIKYAKKNNKKCQFNNIPQQLNAMILAAGLTKIIS